MILRTLLQWLKNRGDYLSCAFNTLLDFEFVLHSGKTMPKIHYVSSVPAAEKAVKKILCLDTPVVGVSCQGVNLGPKGKISSISVGTCEGDVYFFDVRIKPSIVLDGGLIRLLQSVELVKVFHDCSRAAANLHFSYGIRLKNYFDTQVAVSVILEFKGLPPRKITLSSLCERYDIDRYTLNQESQAKLKEDVNFWSLRPVTKALLNAAAADVLPLIPELYSILLQQMDETMWDWFDCKSEEHRLSHIKPEKIQKVKCDRWRNKIHDRRFMFRTPSAMLSKENLLHVRKTVPDTQHLFET